MAQQTLYAVSHTDLASVPFNNKGRTLRLVVQASCAAYAVSVLFSNRCGQQPLHVGAASLAPCTEDGRLTTGPHMPVTVGGQLSFAIAPGEDLPGDEIPFVLSPGQFFAVNLYFVGDAPVTSGNWLGSTAYRSRPGNFSADEEIPRPKLFSRLARTIVLTDMTVAVTGIGQVIAHTETPGALVACFGDSITEQCTWTVPLQKRLWHAWPGQVGLVNLGISGNRLLHDAPASTPVFGQAGIRRFEHDILGLSGLTHCILALGLNDLGQPGTYGIPESEVASLASYAAAMQSLADKLHAHGVKAYAATMTPRTFIPPYDEARERLRREMNDWIRSAACFDAVLDYDAVCRRDDGGHGMKDKYALPDGLHPTPYGGLWIAKSIDLSLFKPEGGTPLGGI